MTSPEGDLIRRLSATARKDIIAAAKDVDSAWYEYIEHDDFEGMVRAVGQLRNALFRLDYAEQTRKQLRRERDATR